MDEVSIAIKDATENYKFDFCPERSFFNRSLETYLKKIVPRLYAAGMAFGGWCGSFYADCGWVVLGTVHWGRKAGQYTATLDT